MTIDAKIPLSEAAQRLGVGYTVAFRLMLEGQLLGERERGKWMVSVPSIERYLSAGRAL